MKTVSSLGAAMRFFLENSTGSVKCEKENGASVIVDNYPEAEAFFLPFSPPVKKNKEEEQEQDLFNEVI